jgi:hypothetical protein
MKTKNNLTSASTKIHYSISLSKTTYYLIKEARQLGVLSFGQLSYIIDTLLHDELEQRIKLRNGLMLSHRVLPKNTPYAMREEWLNKGFIAEDKNININSEKNETSEQ